MRLRCSNIRIDCTADGFQLGYVDSICILRTSCDIGNLTRRFDCLCLLFAFLVIIFHFTVCTADRNGSIGGYPSGIILIGVVMLLAQCVITCFSSFGRGDRIRTKGYTTIDSSVCIIADHDGIFDIFGMILDRNLFGNSVFKRTIRMFIRHSPCGFRLLCNLFFRKIHRAENNVVFPVFQVMIIADDNVVFTIFQGVSCTDNSTPLDIRSSICKTTYSIICTHVLF